MSKINRGCTAGSVVTFMLVAVVGLLPLPVLSNESTTQAAPQQRVRFLGLETALPFDWQQVDPSSSMRLAQFVVADEERGQSAELIFYYFGVGKGGSPEANIIRWQSQFQSIDGTLSKPEVSQLEVSGMPVTRVKLQGSYARGIGAGPGGTGKPNQTLLAAMLQTPQGQVTIQLHGETPLIDALMPDFDRMLLRTGPMTTR